MSKKTKTLPELEADLVILKGRLQVLTAKDDLNNALRRRVTKQIQNLETEISKMKRFDVNMAAPSAKAAAVKLQSVQRGRVGRANAADDELKARFARLTGQPAAKEAVAKTRPSSPPPNVAAKAAATKLQAFQRGRQTRKNQAATSKATRKTAARLAAARSGKEKLDGGKRTRRRGGERNRKRGGRRTRK